MVILVNYFKEIFNISFFWVSVIINIFLYVYNKVKGDGNIDVIIRFIGLGINNNYQAFVKIYDSNNNLVFDGITYNGSINVTLNMYCTYRLEARFLSEFIKTNMYITKCNYVFIFNHSIFNRRTITFLLKDYYYNLPIERGEIYYE